MDPKCYFISVQIIRAWLSLRSSLQAHTVLAAKRTTTCRARKVDGTYVGFAAGPANRLVRGPDSLRNFHKTSKGNNPLNWLVIITATKPGGFGFPPLLSFLFYLPSLLSSWPVSCGATNTSYRSCSFPTLIKKKGKSPSLEKQQAARMEDKREAGETAAGLRLCWIRASRTCVRVLEKKKKYFNRQLRFLKLVMVYFYIFLVMFTF